MSSAETNTFFICRSLWFKKRWGLPWKKILNFGSCFVLCSWAACSAGSLTVSFGTLHTKVTLIMQEEWRGEWHFPSRCCTTVARKCIQNAHTLFKYTPPILHISQDACIYECLHTSTCWYSICATYVEFCSNPLQWQGALLSMCKVYMLISFQLRSVHSFRLISNLCFSIFCLGAYQKCLFCPGKLCIVLLTHFYWECLLLFFSAHWIWRFRWLDFQRGSKTGGLNRTWGSWKNNMRRKGPNSSTTWMGSVFSLR